MASIEIEGFKEKQEQLKHLMTTDPTMRKRLQGCIRKILREVAKILQDNAQSGLGMESDPRKAYKAVRSAVYKRLIGGNVNILQKRKASAAKYTMPSRPNREGKRGGNRWGRSGRTDAVDSYTGADRGFILRFLNQGTNKHGKREVHSYTDIHGNRNNLSRNANRDVISGRDWFGNRSLAEMRNAAQNLEYLIDRVLNDEFK